MTFSKNKLPYEVIMNIMSYLNYSDIVKFENGRHIFYKITSHIYAPHAYKAGAFNNLSNMCFYCPSPIQQHYNVNICRCNIIMKDLKLDFNFPSVCFKCTKEITRGHQERIMCKLCGNKSIHVGITFCS